MQYRALPMTLQHLNLYHTSGLFMTYAFSHERVALFFLLLPQLHSPCHQTVCHHLHSNWLTRTAVSRCCSCQLSKLEATLQVLSRSVSKQGPCHVVQIALAFYAGAEVVSQQTGALSCGANPHHSELWPAVQVLNGSSSKQGPCHVVAPCPHDGRCPMDGTQSWCHFVQRFKRTAQQKHAKVGLLGFCSARRWMGHMQTVCPCCQTRQVPQGHLAALVFLCAAGQEHCLAEACQGGLVNSCLGSTGTGR